MEILDILQDLRRKTPQTIEKTAHWHERSTLDSVFHTVPIVMTYYEREVKIYESAFGCLDPSVCIFGRV